MEKLDNNSLFTFILMLTQAVKMIYVCNRMRGKESDVANTDFLVID